MAYTTKGQILDLEVADGVAFFRKAEDLWRADLRTGEGRILHSWPYDSGAGIIWEVEAGGGRVAVEIGQAHDVDSQVLSMPAAGGPLTTVARDRAGTAGCSTRVYLADVRGDSEVVTDETDCHDAAAAGTLFAYGSGGRRALTSRFVPSASRLESDDRVEVTGDRYIATRSEAPAGTFVGDLVADSARPIAGVSNLFGGEHLNADGDAIVPDVAEDGDSFRERVRLFRRGGGVESFAAPRGTFQYATLCGRWLWIMRVRQGVGRDLVSLTAEDVETSASRPVFRREPERARLVQRWTCAGEGFAFVVHVKPKKEQIRVVAPPGEPASSGP